MNSDPAPAKPARVAPAPTRDPNEFRWGIPQLHEQIISSFCHDLRQPLNAALLRLAALKLAHSSGEDRALLEELHLNMREIANMSESVFDAIRLSHDAIEPSPVAIALDELLGRVRSDFESLAQQRGLRLTVRRCGFIVVTDTALVTRIVANLVQNALRYTRAGGVLVAARHRRGQLVIEVWDSGPGIAPEEIETIFQPYVRGRDQSLEQSMRGNCGVGLWNGREFARILQGTLEVNSRLGRGSVFRLTLPIEVETVASVHQRARAERWVDSARVALVVSDNSQMLGLQRLVLSSGRTHMSFKDPLALLTYLNDPINRPALIIIDLQKGRIETNFLAKLVLARHPELRIAVLFEDLEGAEATALRAAGVNVVAPPLTLATLNDLMLAPGDGGQASPAA